MNPEVQQLLDEAGLKVVAEEKDYFIYAEGSLEPGPFGTRYSLKAARPDGTSLPLAEVSLLATVSDPLLPVVNLGPTSSTRDPLVLRAKADLLSRMAAVMTDMLLRAIA